MIKKAGFFLFFLFFVTLMAGAQNIFNGRVLESATNEPVVGATVLIKGTSTGTITGQNGQFSLSVPQQKVTLVISFVGFKTQELAAGRNMVVMLESVADELEEVLVVAYGTTTKKSFTGAAAVVKGDKLTKLQSSSVSKSLEGAVPGVQISSASGQPGSDAAIRIRGLGSISAGQAPLIVLDGVPYEGSLNSISSQDIESLNVLKDAAANSMYGARGSNGVIVITTKKAAKGKTTAQFEARLGINSRGVQPYQTIQNTGDYYEMMWESVRNSLVDNGMSYFNAGNFTSQNLISQYLGYNIYQNVADNQLIDPFTGKINHAARQLKWNDNWQKEPFNNGLRQEYNFNMTGGSDKTSVYFSGGYLDDQGYVVNSDFKRISARLKLDQQVNQNLKAGANLAYVQTRSNSPVGSSGGSNYSNMFMFSQSIAPIYPVYQYDLATGAPILDNKGVQKYDFGSSQIENGQASTKTRAYAAQQNPIFTQREDISEGINDNLSARTYLEYKFLTDFKFTFNLAYDVFNSVYTSFSTPLAGDALGYGNGYKTADRYEALNVNQLLNYTKKIGLHDFNVLLGHESKANNYWVLEGSKKNFWDPFNPEFVNAGSTTDLSSYTSEYRIEGYLSRMEYNYNDRYYGSVSLRRDGSSKFAPDVRWGNFWSIGGAWRIIDEAFMADVPLLTNLKLKSSFGTQGNDAISGSNLFLDQFSMESDGVNANPVFSYRGAPGLTWEKSDNFNAGFEMSLIDIIQLNADFFIKHTKDMIYAKPLPPSGGVPTWVWDNQIDMKNTGVELDLNVNVIKQKNLKWDIALNATTYKNELTRLPADKDPEGYVAGSYWRKIGGSLYDFYLYDYAGVDAATGQATWYTKDENGKKVTTTDYSDADQYETGKSSIPDFYGGLSTNVEAYGFDFSVQTAFQVGGWVYDRVYAGLMGAGTAGENWSTDIYKRWTPGNTATDVPRVSLGDQNTNALSSRFLIDASYFSIRNITLGYTLPNELTRKWKINRARLYLTGDNLMLLSAREGLDPRQSFTGSTFSGTYSALRTTSVGLTVNF